MKAVPGRRAGRRWEGTLEADFGVQPAEPLREVVRPLQTLRHRQGQGIVDAAGDLVGGEAPVVAPPELSDAKKGRPQCPTFPGCAADRQALPETAGKLHLPPDTLLPPEKLLLQVGPRQLPPPLPRLRPVQSEGIEDRRHHLPGGLPGDGAALSGGIEPGLPGQKGQELFGKHSIPGYPQLIHAVPPLPPGSKPPAPSGTAFPGCRPAPGRPTPWRRAVHRPAGCPGSRF